MHSLYRDYLRAARHDFAAVVYLFGEGEGDGGSVGGGQVRCVCFPGSVRIKGRGRREDLLKLVRGRDGRKVGLTLRLSSLLFSTILDDFFLALRQAC